MIFVSDLMRGLIALQEADAKNLVEPQCGYCIPGLSFTPNELFAEIRKHHPGFGFRVKLNANMNKFAHLWPDDQETTEPLRDLGFSPEVKLSDMVATVLAAHEERNVSAAEAFKAIDGDGTLTLNRTKIEKYVRKHVVRGREDYGDSGQAALDSVVNRLMSELDTDNDGLVSWATFSEWNRRNTLEQVVVNSLSQTRA